MSNYKLTIDADADAAYFYVTDEKAFKTIEINESVLVDVDIDEQTVGVEFLSLQALGSFKRDTLNDFLSVEACAELENLLEKPLRSYLMTNRLALR
jgi:uncharacterized protein YuzE